jgi:hypothetical protein
MLQVAHGDVLRLEEHNDWNGLIYNNSEWLVYPTRLIQSSKGKPLVGISARQAHMEDIGLSKGQHILIHGGTYSIGSISIQLAKYLNARVVATVNANDKQFVQDLGGGCSYRLQGPEIRRSAT